MLRVGALDDLQPVVAAVWVGLNVEQGELELYCLAGLHQDGPAAVCVVGVSARVAGGGQGASGLSGDQAATLRGAGVPAEVEPVVRHAVVRPELHAEDIPGGDDGAVVARERVPTEPAQQGGVSGGGTVIHRQPVVVTPAVGLALQVELGEGETDDLVLLDGDGVVAGERVGVQVALAHREVNEAGEPSEVTATGEDLLLAVVPRSAGGTLALVARLAGGEGGGETGSSLLTGLGAAGILPLPTERALVSPGAVTDEAAGFGDAGGAVQAGPGQTGAAHHTTGGAGGHRAGG